MIGVGVGYLKCVCSSMPRIENNTRVVLQRQFLLRGGGGGGFIGRPKV